MMTPERLAKLVRTALVLRSPPAYTLGRQIKNPFESGSSVWSKTTGIYLGSVRTYSKPYYDNYHWALVGDDLVVFDYELGDRYTQHNPNVHGGAPRQGSLQLHDLTPLPPTAFFVGQRLFYRKDYRNPLREFMGTVKAVFQPLTHGGDWHCQTTSHHNFTSAALGNHVLRIGQRPHLVPLTKVPQ